jgi:hypothetical protein
MRTAILIHGSEERHVSAMPDIRGYLRIGLGIDCVEILNVFIDDVVGKISSYCKKIFPTDQRSLIIYYGHGKSSGWENEIDYADLARCFSEMYWDLNKILLLNCCCSSGALIQHLERHRVSSGNLGVISACPDRLTINGWNFIKDVLVSWGKNKVYVPGDHAEKIITVRLHDTGLTEEEEAELEKPIICKPIRWGATIDHHFYPTQ